MAEAIIVMVFLILLMFMQIREQYRITLAAKRSRIKQILALTLAIMVLGIFWPEQVADQIKLFAFAVLICAIGFLKDGLANDHLVKFGVLNGEYRQFVTIQIEAAAKGQSFVTFYKRKNNYFSLFFEASPDVLETYFNDLGFSEKIINGEISKEKKKAIDIN